MSDALYKELLAFAITYIETHNKRTEAMHRHVRSGQVEPSSVRNEVTAAKKWLERARRVVGQRESGPLANAQPNIRSNSN